jgi:hypothetical protein
MNRRTRVEGEAIAGKLRHSCSNTSIYAIAIRKFKSVLWEIMREYRS